MSDKKGFMGLVALAAAGAGAAMLMKKTKLPVCVQNKNLSKQA